MNNRDHQICEKLLTEIAVIDDLLKGFSLENFQCDERTVRAVCMTLINIGELVKNLTPELRNAHREVPWRAISGMRDVTAHKYQTLRREDVYRTCIDDIPDFKNKILQLLTVTTSSSCPVAGSEGLQ